MSNIAITFLVLGLVVVLFIWNRFPVELVALGSGLALYGAGVINLNAAISGFGDPTVVFIAALFVVSEGLDAGGVVAWIGRELVARGSSDPRRLLVATLVLVAVLTAFITPNGSVAALMPVVVRRAASARNDRDCLLLRQPPVARAQTASADT
ncbi:SLC13 family permease [Jatrophihabitans sp. DSM 45814]